MGVCVHEGGVSIQMQRAIFFNRGRGGRPGGFQRFNFFFLLLSVWVEFLRRLQGALPTTNPLTSNTLL